MPKLGEMAQLSRPFQIALIALRVFVLAWFAVLHRPGGSSTSSPSPSVSSSASASTHSSRLRLQRLGRRGSSSVYHGPAPASGLTPDSTRTRRRRPVEGNGREVQSKAAQGSGEAPSGGTPAAASHSTASAHAAAASASRAPRPPGLTP